MGEGNAKKYGIWLLSRRDYTKKMLADKLKQKGYSEEETAAAIEQLTGYGLLNDAEYARRYVQYTATMRKYGTRRIRACLSRLGIDRDIIDEALEAIDDSEEKDRLLELVKKKLAGNFDIKNINKVKRHFYAKGYSPSDIGLCIRRVTERDCEDFEV